MRPSNAAGTVLPRNFSYSFNKCINWVFSSGNYINTFNLPANGIWPALHGLPGSFIPRTRS